MPNCAKCRRPMQRMQSFGEDNPEYVCADPRCSAPEARCPNCSSILVCMGFAGSATISITAQNVTHDFSLSLRTPAKRRYDV